MTTSCHLTKAPEMKYIDECYQSRPTPPSYRFVGRGGIGLHVVIRSSVLITKLASLTLPALAASITPPPRERESVKCSARFTVAVPERGVQGEPCDVSDCNADFKIITVQKSVVSLNLITSECTDERKKSIMLR